METTESEIVLKAIGETTAIKSSNQSHNPGLKALLALKKFTTTFDEDFTKLMQIETDLDEVNKNGLLIVEGNTTQEAVSSWKVILQEEKSAVKGINDTITFAKEKIEQKIKDGYPELWKQLHVHLLALKDSASNEASTGLNLLPETVHPQWEREFVNLKTQKVNYMVAYVESCRVLLQMIERYTPDELNSITKIIVDHIPADFTYDDAVEYQKDYYKALVNFKKEFKEEKNLWDKFLDILAGGTHQLPSERVMMERWLDGEKEDLK